MKNQHQFPFVASSLKRSRLTIYFMITAGLLLFLCLTLPACSTIRLQINQLNPLNPPMNINLPRDMKSAQEDAVIKKETACVVTIPDNSGDLLIGKDKYAKELITDKIIKCSEGHTPDKRIVYIESDGNVNYKFIVELLNMIRKADIDRVGLVVQKIGSKEIGARPTMFTVKLPAEPRDTDAVMAKPNPLTLVVEINKTGAILLNKDSIGSVNDTTALTNKLLQVFKDREANGVLREPVRSGRLRDVAHRRSSHRCAGNDPHRT